MLKRQNINNMAGKNQCKRITIPKIIIPEKTKVF
jgi:hypothetical protein